MGFLALLLLPKCSADLNYGPCPPARDWGSRVSGLVFISPHVDLYLLINFTWLPSNHIPLQSNDLKAFFYWRQQTRLFLLIGFTTRTYMQNFHDFPTMEWAKWLSEPVNRASKWSKYSKVERCGARERGEWCEQTSKRVNKCLWLETHPYSSSTKRSQWLPEHNGLIKGIDRCWVWQWRSHLQSSHNSISQPRKSETEPNRKWWKSLFRRWNHP